jgi:hemoglobin
VTGPSLYERLGGESAVEAAVVLLHDKISRSPELLPFFGGVEMHDQLQVHISFVMTAFGRVPDGPPKDLRRAHAHLVASGLGDVHFDAIAIAMSEVLDELGVDASDRAEILAHIGQTRPEVLGR